MLKQTVIWTALPNGVAGDINNQMLNISVLVSPRLENDKEQILRPFPDFIMWTRKMREISFRLEFHNGQTVEARVKTTPETQLDDELWRSLFKEDTYVRSHQFDDYSQKLVISYPVRQVVASLKSKYQEYGYESPTSLPNSSKLHRDQFFQDLKIDWNSDIQLSARQRLLTEQTEGQSGTLTDTNQLFKRFLLFHRPPVAEVDLPRTEEDFRNYIDFHQAVSSLGDFPKLLRRLGLVFDLEVPATSVPQSVSNQVSTIRVIPRWNPTDPSINTDRTPKTAYLWDGKRFAPLPSKPEIQGGLLSLNTDLYELVQVDQDGAAMKAINFATNLGRTEVELGQTASIPSLRSGGISVVRNDRARQLVAATKKSKTNNDALTNKQDVLLYAEDLVRGYRVDVWDGKTKAWHSLCKRIGNYSVAGTNIQNQRYEDEGFTQMGVTQVATKPGTLPPANADLYLHESLFRWEGWSLVASRPGKSIGTDPSAAPVQPENTPITPFKLTTSFVAVPRSLPRLRFGMPYQLRARVVDLAGNSISLAEAADNGALPKSKTGFIYLRFEPVNAPAVVLRKPLSEQGTPGESTERLVIRSFNSDPSLDEVATTQISDRHIAPPRTSQLMAEVHGIFDDPNGRLKKDPETFQMIAHKDAGEFKKKKDGNFGDGTTSDNPKDGDTPVEPDEQLQLPYLPDVLARGAALRNLPGTPEETVGQVDTNGKLVFTKLEEIDVRPGSVTQIDFGSPTAWPDALPFRLALADGTSTPNWDAAKRILQVQLPKAEIANVALSSYLNKEDLKLMGIWQWIKEYVDRKTLEAQSDPAKLEGLTYQVAKIVQSALEGNHWMLTPGRELVLVHAVQQPLGRPEFKALVAKRQRGSTAATLEGILQVHGKSTAKLEITAKWQEPIDIVPGEPDVLNGKAIADEIPIKELDRARSVGVGVYDPTADRVTFDENNHPRQEFGDTKYRQVRYTAVATSRFREYFPPDFQGSFTRESEEIVVDVPASGRPAAPKVLYVLPTFGWKRQTTTNLIASERQGGGVRVYLERPWYSSGDGELLGVVVWEPRSNSTAGSAEPPEQLKPYITQWGIDPIWLSRPTSAKPFVGNFPKAVKFGYELSLDEVGNNYRVAVAGHEVKYDSDRQLWYCDIDINAGESYFPFVRLALARYQPNSIADVELSRVILADFIQLSPDRSVIVTYDPYNSARLNVVVSGLTYTATAGLSPNSVESNAKNLSLVEVSLEMRQPDVSGDLGWQPVPATVGQVVTEQSQASGNMLWRGQVTLPSDRQPKQFRLVIKEFEQLYADPTKFPSGLEVTTPYRATRLVYADILEI